MSERWGVCPRCEGYKDDCYLCGGTGFDGSIDALLSPQRREVRKQSDKKIEYEEIMKKVLRAIKK